MPQFDYYYGDEAEQYSFYRIPKVLFTDACFRRISVEAKVLYGLLLDRMALSIKNRWLDRQGRVYIIFTIADIMETLGCAEQKANRLLGELDTAKGAGLIERVRRGLGRPNVIYVKNFIRRPGPEAGPRPQEGPGSQILNCENHKSGNAKITNQDLRKSQTNKTDLNKTDLSNTDQSIPICQEREPGRPLADGCLTDPGGDKEDLMGMYRALITTTALSPDKKTAAHRTDIPVSVSSATMIFLRSALSARIPPTGDKRIVGIVAMDKMPANTAAEPVTSNTYMDNARRRI